VTVSNTSSKTDPVTGTGAEQVLSFDFPITESGDIVVKTRVTATGVEATLTETTHYTVDVDNQTITTVTPYVAATKTITIERLTSPTQEMDLTNGGAFNAEDFEAELDKLTKMIIEDRTAIGQSLRFQDTDEIAVLPALQDRAQCWLYFDTDGSPTAAPLPSALTGTTPTITALGLSLLAGATAAGMRTTLGVVIGTNVQAYSLQLANIAALTPTDGNFIVADGDTWVVETGATARASLGVSATADVLVRTSATAQTVSPIVTFTLSPIVPTPTTATQAANKGYVDGLGLLGALTGDPTTSGWGATQKGWLWFNKTSNVFKYWDGSAVKTVAVVT
jgi:hypothetical protein